MIKIFITLTMIYVSGLLKLMRSQIWLIRKGLSNKVNLFVSSDTKYSFTPYGEIAKILYANQFLIKRNKGWEYKTVNMFKEHIQSGNVIIDIGANIGMYTLLASDLAGSTGKVYAFEPSKETFAVLNKNIEGNNKKNVSTHQLALSNKREKVSLRVPVVAQGRADAFNSIHVIEDDGNKEEGEYMETMTLDQFVKEQQIKEIDFIKIDIEGAELLCLQGARNTLEHIKPRVIVFESFEPFCKRFNYGQADIILYLHKFGYTFSQYDDWQWIAIHNPNNN